MPTGSKSIRISPLGAVVGAFTCAIARSLVVYWATQQPALILMLPSAAIGFLVGAIAGAIGRPIVSAAIGAILSAVVFELFLLPCVSMVGIFGDITGNANLESDFIHSALKYLIGMAVAGGIGGGIGGAVGQFTGDVPKEANDDVVVGERVDQPKSP